jgi:AraC family transcriptional regulator
MEPRIVDRTAFTVVGMCYHGKNENNEIPKLWETLNPRVREIKARVDNQVAYGISANMDQNTGAFDYIAGFEVSSSEEIPEGMVRFDVPGGKYAVFRTTLPRLGETFMHAYRTWAPQSGYQLTGGPDFELYDEAFDPRDPSSEFDVFIPIT